MSDPTLEFIESFGVLLDRWKEAAESGYNSQLAVDSSCPMSFCTPEDWKKIQVAAKTDITNLIVKMRQKITGNPMRNGFPIEDEAYDQGRDDGYDNGYGDGHSEGRDEGRVEGEDAVTEELQPKIDELEDKLEESLTLATLKAIEIVDLQTKVVGLEEEIDALCRDLDERKAGATP